MNAITRLDVLDLEDTIARYGIGELVSYRPAANGIENSNYFLRTLTRGREREFVLTVLEQASNAGTAFVPLLDLCIESGLPVPGILRNLAGEPFEVFEHKPVVLAPRLPGRHVYNPTLRQVEALARFIGRFHVATAGWSQTVPAHPRRTDWLKHHARLTRGYLPYLSSRLLDETVKEVTSLLARHDVQSLPKGVIHADLFRDNVLFNERGLSGVLDFHHASEGFLLYDLAVAANDWCTDASGLLDEERTLRLIRTYHQIRPLSRAELCFFSAFALYAALAFWLSRLAVAARRDETGAVRFNNPEEFQRIVQQHRAHFLYLDERMLEA